ncbi:MAG: hypothetical protein GY807_12830, partial [Gammaproteobacteria bacterium]|nr:hypothetical protein [Gammaproteobacteria bacterium]
MNTEKIFFKVQSWATLVLIMLLCSMAPEVSADWPWSSWFSSDDKPALENAEERNKAQYSVGDEPFDHFSTGFPLTGAHDGVTCEDCHIKGIFKGTPKSCNACHDGVAAGGKSPNHITSTAQCGECHTNVSWMPARFDHGNVGVNCSSCHNGSTATGISSNHIRSSAQCGSCHTTQAWSPTQFDHSKVSESCSSCHNGSTAKGKHAKHIQTTAQCDNCHSNTAWTPAHFDHSGVSGTCSSCHNGSTAKGKH